MKKRDIAVNAIVNFVFILLACIFAAVLGTMAVKFANKFVELSFIVNAGLEATLLFLISAFFVAFLSYKNGYHSAYFDRKEAVPSALLGALLHFAASFITLFTPWISGATKHVSGFIAYGDNYMSKHQMLTVSILILAIVGIFFALVYAALSVLGAYLGTKKRLDDRASLFGENGAEEK